MRLFTNTIVAIICLFFIGALIAKSTDGGSAILETLFPGTPHEMVSVYYDDGGKLGMTHYCMLGNQPQMTLKKADGNRIDLVFVSGGNIDPKQSPNMPD